MGVHATMYRTRSEPYGLAGAVSGQPMETLDMCESVPDESSQCLLNNEELTQLAT